MEAKMTTSEIRITFKTLESNDQHLSMGSINFLRSLKKYFIRNKKLSERQIKALLEMQNSINEVSGIGAT